MIRIGLLGFGTVGSATYEILAEQEASLRDCLGQDITVAKILVRDLAKYETTAAYPLMTTDIAEIINDPSINVLIELTGSIEGIIEPLKQGLASGKHLITANKALLAKHMEELIALASRHNVGLRYEATVAGAIPIISNLEEIIALNQVNSLAGVLNGTCNYLLSRMEEGLDYAEALREAQDLGFSEADPSSDVEGYDTMYKLRILSTLAFKRPVLESEISCTGITAVTGAEIQEALAAGKRIKLVGQATLVDGKVTDTVQPTLVDRCSTLGGLDGGENAVIVDTSNAGELIFSGLGAGGRPTAFAVLSDLIHLFARPMGS